MFGAIEAGGTKFVCGVGTGPEDLKTIQFPTTSPDATLAKAIEFLRQESKGELKAVGIGSFGPIDLHRTSLTFGYVTSTPKVGWQNYNLAGTVRDALEVPVGFDTDVDAAALGEARWGAAQNLTDFVYLTVGTGIGGGAIVNGRVLHGLVHPEMGHIRVPHDLTQGPLSRRLSLSRRLPGRIGLRSSHAGAVGQGSSGFASRSSGMDTGSALPGTRPGELGTYFVSATHCAGRRRARQSQIFGRIRQDLVELLNGYVRTPEVLRDIDQYVVPPQLGGRAGVLGGLVLAEQAYTRLDRE